MKHQQFQGFFASNCPHRSRLFLSLAVFCLRCTFFAQSLQYFARLEPGRNGWPQTLQRFNFSRNSSAVSSGPSSGRTAQRNLVVTSFISLVSPQAVKLAHFAAPPLPAKSYDFAGTPYHEAKYSGRRHIPPRHPEEHSCRCRSCSTHAPAYASGGTADNS